MDVAALIISIVGVLLAGVGLFVAVNLYQKQIRFAAKQANLQTLMEQLREEGKLYKVTRSPKKGIETVSPYVSAQATGYIVDPPGDSKPR